MTLPTTTRHGAGDGADYGLRTQQAFTAPSCPLSGTYGTGTAAV
jgi:hypothetical protein